MKFFKNAKINEFVKIQVFSNEKERKYLDVITNLQTEFENLEKGFGDKIDEMNKHFSMKFDNQINELKKANDLIKSLRSKYE